MKPTERVGTVCLVTKTRSMKMNEVTKRWGIETLFVKDQYRGQMIDLLREQINEVIPYLLESEHIFWDRKCDMFRFDATGEPWLPGVVTPDWNPKEVD
jgi:hypothetical protein